MTKKSCGAVFDGEGDLHLVCELPSGHDGPVHRHDDYEWGDGTLPEPGLPAR